MQLPCININGTAKETLRADLIGALDAARNLVTALQLMSPHGRDFPVRDTYAVARYEHASRIDAARMILENLEAYAKEFGKL